MNATFYTADPHAGHPLVMGLRGYHSLDEYHLALQLRWNAVVSPEDDVWVNGDAALGDRERTLRFFDRLHGTKHLVSGNHDHCWGAYKNSWTHQALYLRHFASVQDFAVHRFGGRQVLLSHFPYAGDHTAEDRYSQFRLRSEGTWLLHGHTHSPERQTSAREIHVGLDAWDLAPASQDAILAIMAAQEVKESSHASDPRPPLKSPVPPAPRHRAQ